MRGPANKMVSQDSRRYPKNSAENSSVSNCHGNLVAGAHKLNYALLSYGWQLPLYRYQALAGQRLPHHSV